MKKKRMWHFKVLSLIKDSLLSEVDEWRQHELTRLFDKKDPTVTALTAEGLAAERLRKKKKRVVRSIIIAVIVLLSLLGGIGTFLLLHGNVSGGNQSGGNALGGSAPHVHSLTVFTKTATCTEGGYVEQICTDEDCDYRLRTEEIAPLGHTQDTPVRENEIAADCLKEGSYDEMIYCSSCAELLSQKIVTTPSIHMVQTVLYKGGDCTAGMCYETAECLACGERSRTDLTLSPQSEHAMENGACTACGMPESSPGLAYEAVSGKNEYRVIGIGSCTDKDIVIGTYRGHTVSEVCGLTKTSIETVTLSDGVRTVGAYAFEHCSSLKSVTMGEGMKTVDVRAFSFCTALCELSLGKNLEEIGIHAFWGCSALAGTVSIPASVSSLSYDAFMATGVSAFAVASDNLAYTAIDGNLYTKDGKTLMKYASARMETRFVVPDGVERILLGAISSQTLTEIVLPKSVRYIASSAISSPVLESVFFREPNGWLTIFDKPVDPQSFADPQTAADILTALNDGFKRKVD